MSNQTAYAALRLEGGKLLIAHGTADVLVSPRATEQYFERLKAAMGEAKVREFVASMRFQATATP